jgi:intraflagellar transport protein 172
MSIKFHYHFISKTKKQQVRVGNLKTNKAATLYQTESCVVSATSSQDGHAIISGHLDGSISRFYFDDAVSGAAQVRGQYTYILTPNQSR